MNTNIQNIKNIITNTQILQKRYNDCIANAKMSFKEAEKKFIETLIEQINLKLEDWVQHKTVDFTKDIMGHWYEVIDICNYKDWSEFKEYAKFIEHPFDNHGQKLKEFIRNSLKKYDFPLDNIFDVYDNGVFRYQLIEYNFKGLSVGKDSENYE